MLATLHRAGWIYDANEPSSADHSAWSSTNAQLLLVLQRLYHGFISQDANVFMGIIDETTQLKIILIASGKLLA
jgi:hypothetical protein